MTNVGRYWDCPAHIRIRGNRRTFKQWLLRKFFRPAQYPDLLLISDYHPAYYPSGYKK